MFCDRLKQARKKAGITQEALAQTLGIAKSTLSGYELGTREPPMAIIAKLMEKLNVDANFLFQDEVPKLQETCLSDKEKTLIAQYRKLNTDNAEKLLKYAEGMVTCQESEHLLNLIDQKESTA